MRDRIALLSHAPHQHQPASTEGALGQIEAELQCSPYFAVRRIRCDVQDGVVTLKGCVPSYYEKQVAQTVVQLCLSGQATIRNELEVPAGISRS